MIKKNSQLLGFILGIIGPMIGAVIYYFMQFSHMPLQEFFEMAIETDQLGSVISLSVIFNLFIFFFFIWKNLALSARGVILATFVYVLIVILVKFT